MGENTKIEWADHTLNWWIGCEPVSLACAGCYAEAWAKRAGRVFSERKLTTEHTRNAAFRYQGDLTWRMAHGRKPRVFVNSLSDFFDNQAPQEWRDSFFRTAKATPDVTYMLLTKRIGNAIRMLPADWVGADGELQYKNIWIGSTVVTQEEAARDVPKLLRTPAWIHFLSIEPMIEHIELRRLVLNDRVRLDALLGRRFVDNVPQDPVEARRAGLEDAKLLRESAPSVDWVIAGGESGPDARPSNPDWFRHLRDDCADAAVPFFFKQWGEWGPQILPPVRNSHRWPINAGEPSNGLWSYRVGKRKAGAMLDGREHKEHPR